MENILLVLQHEGTSRNETSGGMRVRNQIPRTCHLEMGTLNPHTLVAPNISCSLISHLLSVSYFVLSTVQDKG